MTPITRRIFLKLAGASAAAAGIAGWLSRPMSKAVGQPLTQEQVQAVIEWIQAGAPNN